MHIRATGALQTHIQGAATQAGWQIGEQGADALVLIRDDIHTHAHASELSGQEMQAAFTQGYHEDFALCHATCKGMQARGGGTVVIIVQDYAQGGVPHSAAASAVAGAMVGLAGELCTLYPAVRANAIMMGPRFGAVLQEAKETRGKGAADYLHSVEIVRPRDALGDLAKAALFLADDKSAPMRGQTLPINGGIQTLAHPFCWWKPWGEEEAL